MRGRNRQRSCTVMILSLCTMAPHAGALPPSAVPGQLRFEEGSTIPARPGQAEAVAPSAALVESGTFAALNVGMFSRVPAQSFSTSASCTFSPTGYCANDVWGYVSPSGREYAILGLRTGTGFVDITSPAQPVVVGAINDADSAWSDMRTYGTYAYNVNESGGGMQIIDLSQIDPPTRLVTLLGSLTANGLQTVHNLTLNVDSGYIYLCGSNLGGGRLVAVSLADPANPMIAGQAIDPAYVHDAEVVSYVDGPYAGREIAFCYCGSSGFKIIDVTNKANMFTMATLQYPDRRYTHQGRLSADRQYVFLNDELDELQDPDVVVTTTRVIDVSILEHPVLVTTFTSGLETIDHNLMVRGDFVFEANYTSGLRIFNAGDIGNIFQAGWFDTYPFNDGMTFDGAWGVFVDFPSGVVIVSDRQHGLFVLDVSAAEALTCPPVPAPQNAPNANPKPRHLSVSFAPTSTQSALRVTVTGMPPEHAAFIGQEYWADVPVQVPNQKSPGQFVWQSRLTCSPVYTNWSSYGTVHIGDDEIVPGAAYDVQPVALGCEPNGASSAALSLATAAIWGDVAGGNGNSPDGGVTIVDVASIVDVVKNIANSPDVSQTDLHPGVPDFVVNIIEVGRAVDAVKGFPYPYSGPSACP